MAGSGSSWFRESEMLYKYVIDTVMMQCKEHFLDEGCPEDVLLDLKAVWEQHVESSNATSHQHQSRLRIDSKPKTSAGNSRITPQLDGDTSNGDPVKADPTVEAPITIGISEEITEMDDEPGMEDPEELFETDNILVCQYKNIVRKKNKFRLHLKSGIMTLNEKDYVFAECVGEADW